MNFLGCSVRGSALLLAVLFSLQSYALERKERVLVLHSYHQGLEWTDNVTQGIQDVFEPYDYELHYEYLDTKRNTGRLYQDRLRDYFLLRNRNLKFQLVLVSDNSALNFALKYRESIFKDTPIIFCGVNNYKPDLLKGIKDITGVAEYADYQATLEMIHQLHPDKRRVHLILDKTVTGDAIYNEILEKKDSFPEQLELIFHRNYDLDSLLDIVGSLEDKDVIYLLSAARYGDNKYISYNEVIGHIQAESSVPIYSSWDVYLDKGIVGGAITSGIKQGQEAANLALRVLNGESISGIDPIQENNTDLILDHHYLSKFGLSEAGLTGNVAVINKPFSFYEKYKTYLYLIAGIIALLVLYSLYQHQRLKVQKVVNDELDRRVKEKTASLEQVNRQLERISQTDGLTQLYNRGHFDQCLTQEWKRMGREKLPLSLLMCDIDFFKQYNDRYGHVAGDECIKKVADAIQSICQRTYDLPARYGGEEFAILLPQTALSDATLLAAKLKETVKNLSIEHQGSAVADVITVSIGVASMVPEQGHDVSDIVHQADLALYSSKDKGRDQITVYEDPILTADQD